MGLFKMGVWLHPRSAAHPTRLLLPSCFPSGLPVTPSNSEVQALMEALDEDGGDGGEDGNGRRRGKGGSSEGKGGW